MKYRIGDHREYKAFKKILDDNNIKYTIEWKPCCVALFHIEPTPEQVWCIQYGYCDMRWKIYG